MFFTAKRGIQTVIVNARPDGQYLAYDLLEPLTGQTITRKRRLDDGTPKYLWDGKKPHNVTYLTTHPNLKDAGHTIYLASGDMDMMTWHAAGFPALFWPDGETSVPKTLADDLKALGFSRAVMAPDRDTTGRKSAQKVKTALLDSGIEFIALELSDYGEHSKRDINDLWCDCEFKIRPFYTVLVTLPHMDVKPIPKPAPRPKHPPQNTTGPQADWTRIREIWIAEEIIPALPEPVKGKHSHCPNPHHNDKNPSFRVSYDRGFPHPVCTCDIQSERGAWDKIAEWVGARDIVAFAKDRRLLPDRPQKTRKRPLPEEPPVDYGEPPQPTLDADLIMNKPFLEDGDIPDSGVIAVKWHKGGGKSTQARRIIAAEKQRGGRGMVVTPLVTLNRNASEAYDIESYESVPYTFWSSTPFLSICGPSFARFFHTNPENRSQPTVLILDELPDLLRAAASPQLFEGNKGREFLVILKWMIKQARLVLILDADLPQSVIDWLRTLRDDVTVIENIYRPDSGQMLMAPSLSALETDLHNAVAVQEGPIYVHCSTRSEVERLEEHLKNAYPEKRILAIHQNNSSNTLQRAFVENPDEIEVWDVVITSPSVRTGLSIDQPVWRAYLIGTGLSSSAPQLLQGLARARVVTDRTMAFVNDTRGTATNEQGQDIRTRGNRLETPAEVYNRYRRQSRFTKLLIDFNDAGERDFSGIQREFLVLQSKLEAERNRSLNDLRNDFIRLAKQTYELVFPPQMPEGVAEALNEAAKRVEERRDALRINPDLEPIDFEEHQRRSGLGIRTTEDNEALYRYQAREFYGQDLTPELYAFDKQSGKKRLRRFIHALLTPVETLKQKDLEEALNRPEMNRRHHTIRQQLARRLLTEIFGGPEAVNPDTVIFQSEATAAMARMMDQHQRLLWMFFGWREDHSDDPWNTLTRFMRDMGLPLVDTRRKGEDKQYRIDRASWAQMHHLASRRLAYLAEKDAEQEAESWGLQDSGKTSTPVSSYAPSEPRAEWPARSHLSGP